MFVSFIEIITAYYDDTVYCSLNEAVCRLLEIL